MNASGPAAGLWADALLSAACLTLDPSGLKGIHVRSAAGPVRDRFVDIALGLASDGAPVRRLLPHMPASSLTGGLDLAATLAAGRPVAAKGVLAATDEGSILLPMAERLGRSAVAAIAGALDSGGVSLERDGLSLQSAARFVLFALDEGVEDERLPEPLADRLALRATFNGVSLADTDAEAPDREALQAASRRLPAIPVPEPALAFFCELAQAAGSPSLRTPIFLARVARACAALRGANLVEAVDCAAAARLVLGLTPPAPPEDETEGEPEPDPDQRQAERPPSHQPGSEAEGQQEQPDASREVVLEAVAARLPLELLDLARASGAQRDAKAEAGRSGVERKEATRGRRVATTERSPGPDARIDLLGTLRAAAPWQRVRAGAETKPAGRIAVRKSDFRYARYLRKSGVTAICAVDASGSAALERLAETKGAIEYLLARCYARRDSVALVAFRGIAAQALLEPTRSLARAKRLLAALPGGGGTPLAAGIRSALDLALSVRRKGGLPMVFLMTDGRGNVALDGSTQRDRAAEDVTSMARMFRRQGVACVLIDTASRPQARARALAAELGADYLQLPRAGPSRLAAEIDRRMEGAPRDAARI